MQRPASVTVFGALNLVFGVLGVMGLVFSAVLMFAIPQGAEFAVTTAPPGWTIFSLAFGVLAAIVLFVSGIGLLLMRPWGRFAAIGYAIASIAMAAIGLVIHWLYVVRPVLAQFDAPGGEVAPQEFGAALGGLIGGCMGPIYPALLWFFMTRPSVVAAFGGVPMASSESSSTAAMQIPAEARDAGNPYVSPQADAAQPWGGADQLPAPETVVQTFVPTRNGPALAAYYLGLLALLPCLGFPLGAVAVYFGVQGVRRVRNDPTVRGGLHAWAGIICGGLFGLINLALAILVVIGVLAG